MFCPNCGNDCLEFLTGVGVFVCGLCDKAFTVVSHDESVDKLRRVAEE